MASPYGPPIRCKNDDQEKNVRSCLHLSPISSPQHPEGIVSRQVFLITQRIREIEPRASQVKVVNYKKREKTLECERESFFTSPASQRWQGKQVFLITLWVRLRLASHHLKKKREKSFKKSRRGKAGFYGH
jgi:hypothetical protein